MSKLNKIMNKYGTDKQIGDHSYTPFYEKVFKGKENNKLKVLEIGIFRQGPDVEGRPEGFDSNGNWLGRRLTGASLKTWYDYLPKSDIYGIDLSDFSDVNNDRIKTFICNQESKEDLNKLIEKIGSDFDVIIDDGGHTMKQHQISLSVLFKHLKSGGIYVIEDLHTCHIPSYVNGDKTTLDVLNNYITNNQLISDYITTEERLYIEKNIKNIEIGMAKSSEIALIYKK